MSPSNVCKVCLTEPEFTRLNICQMCHARLCNDHTFRRSGKVFCARRCCEEFFLGDMDDDGDLELS